MRKRNAVVSPMPRRLPPRISGTAASIGQALTEQNGTDRVRWLPLGPSPFSGREPRNVAWTFETQMPRSVRGRKVGDVMLLPILIFMMILSPVLLPALTTAFYVARNRRRNSRSVVQPVITHGVVGVVVA